MYRTFKHRLSAVTAAAAAVAVSLGGCGSQDQAKSTGPTYAQLRAGLSGSPAPLAAVHSQMGEVLVTGKKGFDASLRSLRGYPTVVNMWASWCGPCRYEFPVLSEASLQYGKQVGFLGIATREQPGNSAQFLKDHPVGYPSFADESGQIASTAGAGPGLPVTSIYDAKGQRTYVHQGPYRSVADLKADLVRYGGLR